ncbi:MAG: hypothetical protein EBR09_11340 [Proteobacteria bacterium]|nr:hypothetical protein [Pseudomonadota bacterium]
MTCYVWQIGTTKGTGGDVLVLEEAAYCDESFFYGARPRVPAARVASAQCSQADIGHTQKQSRRFSQSAARRSSRSPL